MDFRSTESTVIFDLTNCTQNFIRFILFDSFWFCAFWKILKRSLLLAN